MAKKQIQKGKKTNPKKITNEAAASEDADNVELTRLESLQADFLQLNDNCPETALLAACQQLYAQAEELQELKLYRRSAIAGFDRRFNQSLLKKS